MRVINISHGEMVMLGAYVTFWLFHLVGFNPLLSLLLSMPALFLVGLFMERFFVARVLDLPEITSLLLTFGFSILMVNMALYFWTADFRSVEYLTGSVKFGGLYFSLPRLVAFWVA
ncbi:MAG: branched-chain amino acid ABC transporter permease, partial [Candidatus Tectimicrobiota bacterium]